jgi:DNA-binding transcriptional regulator YdaS (Cro superfamily)
MTLADYINEHGRGTLTRLAREIGTSKGYLSDLVNDPKRRPSVDMAKSIEAATGGTVTAISLLGLDRKKAGIHG